MSKESWFKALSFLPSRFHTADSPVEVLRRAMNPEPLPHPPTRVIQITLNVPASTPAPQMAAQVTPPQYTAPQPLPAAPQPPVTQPLVPTLADVMRGGARSEAQVAVTPLMAEPSFVPELEVIPDEALLASYDPALEDHLIWEGPHFAPDIPDTLDVPPPTTTLPEVVMAEEETALARLSQQFQARAAQFQQTGDAFHLPDFGPDEVDETQQLLNSLRGKGQQAIRSGLQSYLN
ncbi:hypothetical protein Dxin01_03786 [Deinococcus xinjiangensis]|uniref:Uncharacterized protein n=1 Tax=Deinococcus xinjiangensis TaxID=457454 RepID=A0ABP9VIU4_9DEIO